MKPSAFWAWSDDDRAYAVALLEHEASLDEFGVPVDEATSADADPDNRKGTYRYIAESVLSYTRLAASEHLRSFGDKDPHRDARVIRVHRVSR